LLSPNAQFQFVFLCCCGFELLEQSGFPTFTFGSLRFQIASKLQDSSSDFNSPPSTGLKRHFNDFNEYGGDEPTSKRPAGFDMMMDGAGPDGDMGTEIMMVPDR
jgi:hypothetical protein